MCFCYKFSYLIDVRHSLHATNDRSSKMLIFLSNNNPFSNMLPSPLLAYMLCDLRQYSFTKIKCLSHTDTNLLNYALNVEISVKSNFIHMVPVHNKPTNFISRWCSQGQKYNSTILLNFNVSNHFHFVVIKQNMVCDL